MIVGPVSGNKITLHNIGSKPITVPASEYKEALDKNALAELLARYAPEQSAEFKRDLGLPK